MFRVPFPIVFISSLTFSLLLGSVFLYLRNFVLLESSKMYCTNYFLLNDSVNYLSLSHSEPNIATAFGRRSRRKVIAEQRTASSRLFIIPFISFGMMNRRMLGFGSVHIICIIPNLGFLFLNFVNHGS